MVPDHDNLAREFHDTLRAYRSVATAELRVYYIRRLMAFADANNQHILDLTPRDLTRWLAKSVGQSPWTKRTAKSSLSVFFTWAHTLRLVEHNPADGLPSMRAPRGVPNPCPESAIREALNRCTRRIDVLMIFLGEYQGLRAGEIAQLHTNDIVDDQIRVRGKGSRDRIVPSRSAAVVAGVRPAEHQSRQLSPVRAEPPRSIDKTPPFTGEGHTQPVQSASLSIFRSTGLRRHDHMFPAPRGAARDSGRRCSRAHTRRSAPANVHLSPQTR